MSFKIKSGFSLASSFWEKSPDRTAAVFAPAAFPAFMSEIESPTMMQSQIWASMAFTHFMSASGEGFGLWVSNAVTTWVKYFAMPKCSSSFMMFSFVTARMVMRASLAFSERVFSVAETFGKSLVFSGVMA